MWTSLGAMDIDVTKPKDILVPSTQYTFCDELTKRELGDSLRGAVPVEALIWTTKIIPDWVVYSVVAVLNIDYSAQLLWVKWLNNDPVAVLCVGEKQRRAGWGPHHEELMLRVLTSVTGINQELQMCSDQEDSPHPEDKGRPASPRKISQISSRGCPSQEEHLNVRQR